MGLAEEFHRDMIGIYERARDECNYRPTRFLDVIYTKGGVAAAKNFLGSDKTQEGLFHLYELGRLDLSMEILVLKKKYKDLFLEEERTEARKRLKELGYEIKEDKI